MQRKTHVIILSGSLILAFSLLILKNVSILKNGTNLEWLNYLILALCVVIVVEALFIITFTPPKPKA